MLILCFTLNLIQTSQYAADTSPKNKIRRIKKLNKFNKRLKFLSYAHNQSWKIYNIGRVVEIRTVRINY